MEHKHPPMASKAQYIGTRFPIGGKSYTYPFAARKLRESFEKAFARKAGQLKAREREPENSPGTDSECLMLKGMRLKAETLAARAENDEAAIRKRFRALDDMRVLVDQLRHTKI